MGWRDQIVYYRDFAYNARRLRMANGTIDQVSAATFAELLSGPMIDIYVGEARRRWTLHRNLLCHHSELLEAELEGGDATQTNHSLQLPDHDPAGFELLVKWLYQGKLDDVSDLADANQKYEYAVSCHKLYLLCDRFDLPQLKNLAMDQYRKGLNEAELVPDAEEIDDIYSKSPPGSPFRLLMTRIAARQIMDPTSYRDVETYRRCFEHNPDFAVDLVKAIRLGTGGMLFDDPTEAGNKCEYHDHEASPNCPVKGKARAKQVQPTLQFAKSTPSTSFVQPHPLPRPHPPNTTRQPLPHPAHPQGGISAGPLRRRITSPAISIVGTSMETATATQPPSPSLSRDYKWDKERLKRVASSEKRVHQSGQNQTLRETDTQASPLVHGERLQSSGGGSRRSITVLSEEDEDGTHDEVLETASTRRTLWDWAMAGTGKLSIMRRMSHPDGKDSIPFNMKNRHIQDDFSVPSTTGTKSDKEVAAVRFEGSGMTDVSPTTSSSHFFSQTKHSSDDLVADSSSTGSPEFQTPYDRRWDHDISPPRTPDTPTCQQQQQQPRKDTPLESNHSPTEPPCPHAISDSEATLYDASPVKVRPERKDSVSTVNSSSSMIPKYKIALAPRLLSPGGADISST